MSQDLATKYEAWATKLQQNVSAVGRRRRLLYRMIPVTLALSALGFLVGPWLGVATLATGLMVCIAGVYITTTRSHEYAIELARTRDQLRRLRAAQ